jgi:uncharacterized iron-regulated membrane protein
MSPSLRLIHRYLSLTFAALWLMQALTGAILVFHWELDDWSVRGPAGPLDVAAFSRALQAYPAAYPGHVVSAVYASGGESGRFDVMLDRSDGHQDVLRVDGRGEVLRERPSDYDWPDIGPYQIATYLHQTLFAGDRGQWFLGVSGVLLLSNLHLGLTLAWPRAGQWTRALRPSPGRTPAMGLFAWHRALGLWLGVLGVTAVALGICMAFEDPLGDLIADPRPSPSLAVAGSIPERATPVTPAEALRAGMGLYPGSPLASLVLPAPDWPWYRVRVVQPGEWRRVQGLTTIYVSSRDGRILANDDALRAPLANRAYDSLYALHTGEAGGLATRWLAVIIGVWLAAMVGLGVGLWFVRRSARGRASAARGGRPPS